MSLWSLMPQRVTPAEKTLLHDAAMSPDESVSDQTHPHARRAANSLARKRLVRLQVGAEAGWEKDMWVATLTAPGWNALWRANGDRHEPGCGGEWLPEGFCGGCGAHRVLDVVAFDTYVEHADADERAFLTGHGRLWCDEHGFARQAQWSTDKTCRQPGSPYHERSFHRV